MFCSQCGLPVPDDARFCAGCGRTVGAGTPIPGHPPSPAIPPVTPAPDALGATPTAVGLTPGALLLSRYRIVRLLGRGGMGEVYLAEDVKLTMPVAVKTVSGALAQDPGAVARLKEEAKLAMRLAHPHVVRVNHFEDRPPLTFLVMEYVEGESLAHRLARERRLGEAEASRIGVALCEGLAHAHEKGVLHRDLKPANVLLGKDGSVKLADFGIARVARDSVSRLTGVQTSGTLLYMAPEQVLGQRATAASDLYGLGALLYEVLAGDPPFHTGDLTYQILHQAPNPLTDATEQVGALVQRLLAKDPAERPAAAAVRATLARTESSEPAAAAPNALVGRPAKPGRERPVSDRSGGKRPTPGGRRRIAWLAVALGAAVAVASIAYYIARAAGDGLWPAWRRGSEASLAAVREDPRLPDLRWARIPAGTFLMGCLPDDGECREDEKPRHPVTLARDFDLMTTEVTVGMFRAYGTATGRLVPNQGNDPDDRKPVVNVTAGEASAFCSWVGGRLPSEAEWERAARGGSDTTKFAWGSSPKPLSGGRAAANVRDLAYQRSNYGKAMFGSYDDGFAALAPVASLAPNAYGLYDIAGNAWEMVADWHGRYSGGPATDPTGPSTGSEQVLRGGSSSSDPVDVRTSARSALRIGRNGMTGFRCAMDPANRDAQRAVTRQPVAPVRMDTRVSGLQWATIPAGTFWMGCLDTEKLCQYSDQTPRHEVTLTRPFEIMTTEAVVWLVRAYSSETGRTIALPSGSRDGNQPVAQFTWQQAQAFCGWLGGRLPTEAEWEYAARGRLPGMAYPWGNEDPVDRPGALNGARTNGETAGVGAYAPNGSGLYDMAGNVEEWVADWYGEYDSKAVTNPAGPSSGDARVVRGGDSSRGIFNAGVARRLVVGGGLEGERILIPDFAGVRCVRDVSPRR